GQGFLRQAQDPIPAAAELYGIDSNLRRTSKTQGGAAEVYVFEGLDRVATLGPTGAVKEGYLFDGIDHPLRINRGGTNTYYEVDLAGNVRGLRASGGASLGGYRYSAFGQTLEDTTSITQPLRWKGRWFSPVAGGTYDVRARQWSPELGVFLSVDEFRYLRVGGTLWGWPGQNPVRFRDPHGRYAVGPAVAAGTAVGGPAVGLFILGGAAAAWAGAAIAHDIYDYTHPKVSGPEPAGPKPGGPAPSSPAPGAPAPGAGPAPSPSPGSGGPKFPECAGEQSPMPCCEDTCEQRINDLQDAGACGHGPRDVPRDFAKERCVQDCVSEWLHP
ncbi:MAG: hypothetical protein JWP87_2183, partial [Labilithrix sp.]|nr:hypothetical protein [Labilithrix sp.]